MSNYTPAPKDMLSYIYYNNWRACTDERGNTYGKWLSKDGKYSIVIQGNGMFTCFTTDDGCDFYSASSYELARHAVYGYDCAAKALENI